MMVEACGMAEFTGRDLHQVKKALLDGLIENDTELAHYARAARTPSRVNRNERRRYGKPIIRLGGSTSLRMKGKAALTRRRISRPGCRASWPCRRGCPG
ncbi:hypothetical protein, partial [Burkholderia anthinoferrum]